MASITVWDGANSVGGAKILLQDEGLILWLDFGNNLSRQMSYYEEYMKPQTTRGLYELLMMGLLPPVQGIYNDNRFIDEYLFTEWQAELDEVHGVLLSHAHLDHAGCIQYLRAEVPLYCSTESAFLLKALQECGQGDYGTIVVRNHERKDGDLNVVDWRKEVSAPYRQVIVANELPTDASAHWETLPNNHHTKCEVKPLQVLTGDINGHDVLFFPVDHSIPGAGAWAVETSAGWVVYTGDLRFRGKNRQLSEDFLRQAAALKPVALIIEGTRIGKPGSGYTEDDVCQHMEDLLQKHLDKLVIANFSMTHLDRMQAFWECAKRCDRQFVVNPKDMYLLEAWHYAGHPLSLKDSSLALYVGTGAKPALKWEQELYERYDSQKVTAKEIGKNPAQYLLCFGYYDLNELPYIGVKGGVWVQSFSEPFNEEQRIDDARLNRWLQWFDFCRYPKQDGSDEDTAPLHVSGHASGEELQRVVETIRPQTLIAVHTEEPQAFVSRFRGICQPIVLPKIGEEMTL